LPAEAYPIRDLVTDHLPHLSVAQAETLSLWSFGTVLAGSGCQSAVLTALEPVVGPAHAPALRNRLREWLYDGADKHAACRAEIDIGACFGPLLAWVLRWWRGEELALALDATALKGRLVVASVSVLYRGMAMPVAWYVTHGHRPGAYLAPALDLLRTLATVVPPTMRVLVMADRGLWSPRLWGTIQDLGWHPLMRVRPDATFRPQGGERIAARTLVPEPGRSWIGAGVAFKHAPVRQAATLVAVWDIDQKEPWLLLTDLPPEHVEPGWYGLRTWIELGFRALKSFGWHWERSRRIEPQRVARHWLILAVATLWTAAVGTRVEDAVGRGADPARIRVATPPDPAAPPRRVSVFARGLSWLRWRLPRQGLRWKHFWLWPEPWPARTTTLIGHRHVSPPEPDRPPRRGKPARARPASGPP